MNINKLKEMEARHREEILSLLSETDDMVLEELCKTSFVKDKNMWKCFRAEDCKIGTMNDHHGFLHNMRTAGIIIHEYGYEWGINWFSINPEFRTLLLKKYGF